MACRWLFCPFPGAVADVATVIHSLEVDLADGLVGAIESVLERGSSRGDAEDAATGGDELSILLRSPGMEDLHAGEARG